jgi:hypothetical protein
MIAATPPSATTSAFKKLVSSSSLSNKNNADADENLPLSSGPSMMQMISDPTNGAALRFEDLTIDDDLSLLERVVRYVRSGIALQRLVHVKVLAETARLIGYV